MGPFYQRLFWSLYIYSFVGCSILLGKTASGERYRNYESNTSSITASPSPAHPFLHWVQKSVDGNRKEWTLKRKQFHELNPSGRNPDAISFLQVGASTLAVQDTDNASQHALCTCRLEAVLPGSAGAVKDLVETIGTSPSGGPAQLPAFRQSRIPNVWTPSFLNTGKNRVSSNAYPAAAIPWEQGKVTPGLQGSSIAVLPRFLPMPWTAVTPQIYTIPEYKRNVPFLQSRALIEPHEFFSPVISSVESVSAAS